MLFQGDAPEGSDTFQWQLGEEIAKLADEMGRARKIPMEIAKLADEMGRARKIPMVHYRVMHRKRETSELHDSYFRLMTIKHSISKIEWVSNDYIIQLSSTSQWQLS